MLGSRIPTSLPPFLQLMNPTCPGSICQKQPRAGAPTPNHRPWGQARAREGGRPCLGGRGLLGGRGTPRGSVHVTRGAGAAPEGGGCAPGREAQTCALGAGSRSAPWPGRPPSGRGRALSSPAPARDDSVRVLLFLEREKKRMPPGEVDALEVGDDSLEDERKIPLKLMRRGDRGGDSW